jgi:hypothetical protein
VILARNKFIILEGFTLKNIYRSSRFFVVMLLLCVVLFTNGGCGGSDNLESSFAGGQGTLSAPYQIATAEQLAKVNDHVDRHFILVADIDLSGYDNWKPIGPYQFSEEDMETPIESVAFTGSFDGNGHKISNVTIRNGSESLGSGLFGCVIGNELEPSIKNLTVEKVDVIGGCMVGGVAGYLDGTILNVKLTGKNKVEGSFIGGIGGIVGMGWGVIENCYAENTEVLSTGVSNQGIGIICGGGKNISVRNCQAKGKVTASGWGAFSVGGLIGCIQDSPIMENCTVDATVITGEKSFLVGGLVGHAGNYDPVAPTTIRNCSAKVEITASNSSKRVGGLLGGNLLVEAFAGESPELSKPSLYRIVDCTTSGTISGNADQVGSIAGYGYNSTITGCNSTITWTGGSVNQVGKMQGEGETPEAIGSDFYPGAE